MENGVTASTKKILPWLVAIAFFMEALDTTVLNTAVPTIAAALEVLPLSMKSVLSSYTLSLAVFIPISSWVADRYGTRRVFATAIGLFTLGSVLCGICTNLHLLVLCRIIQGAGGAMMVPVGRLTLVRTFARNELVGAMTFVGIPALVGPMLGPLAGGLIVHYFHWRAIFFINLPIGLLGLYFVYHHLPDYRATKRERLDVVGFILFGSGVALLSYVLEVFGEHTLRIQEILGLFFLAVGLLAGYWRHARGMARPLLRLSLMRLRTFRIPIVGNLTTRLAAAGMPFLLPLLYQLGLGYSPVESGLLTLPQSLTALTLKITMPKILAHFGYRNILRVNTVAMGTAILTFGFVTASTPVWLIAVQSCFFGFCSSLQYTSMNTLVYSDVPEPDTGMASTILSTVQQMAMSFGVATASLCAAFFIPNRDTATVAELIAGIHTSFFVLGGMTILSTVNFVGLRPDDGQNVSQHHSGVAG